ncbi:MAG: HAMP domain-containing protein [Magnetococcales bacterium]|nr:HAMP domain-containing protein [Magnetococcales bacterium]
MELFKSPSSLRRKITLGYIIIGGLIMSLASMAFLELHQMETRIHSVSGITDFLNAVLELRRYEKNFFLYGQKSDWESNHEWLNQAEAILFDRIMNLIGVAGKRTELIRHMTRYRQLMGVQYQTWSQSDATLMTRKEQVRQAGKVLATIAEEMAVAEKIYLSQTLERHQKMFLLAIVLLAVVGWIMGRILAKVITVPLQNLEQTMQRIAQGETNRIDLESGDQEIRSLIQAFNRMLLELSARQKQMVRSEKLASLGTMLSGVAHELNNPLSNIATSCQILMEEIPSGSFHRELLDQIDSQTFRARDIVRSLLDFARDQPFQRQSILLEGLVQETLRLLRAHLVPEITVGVRVEPDLVVMADRQRLQQALLNLIKNALDALPGCGEITITSRYLSHVPDVNTGSPNLLVVGNLAACAMGPVVEIVIQDNGTGIEPALLPRILDPFFTTKETGKGFGLGLFVVHKLIEEQGGCLVIDSQPGSGSTFQMYLPHPSRSH